MSEKEPQSSWVHQVLEVVEHHAALARLEGRYEWGHWKRRGVSAGVAVVFFLLAFLLGNAALVAGFWHWQGGPWVVLTVLASVYGAAGVGLWYWGKRRDPRVGKPFEVSREEWEKSWQWIRKNFS